MTKGAYICFFSAIVFAFAAISCQHKPDLDNYNWMLGNWELPGNDTNTFESWNKVSDTLYEGFNYRVHHNDTIWDEHLWLESRNGKVIFSAIVYGHNNDRRIFFDLDLRNKKLARFVNHNHDFPTVIEYHKTGHHFLEVQVRNEEISLPPIKMHKLNPDGTFVK